MAGQIRQLCLRAEWPAGSAPPTAGAVRAEAGDDKGQQRPANGDPATSMGCAALAAASGTGAAGHTAPPAGGF